MSEQLPGPEEVVKAFHKTRPLYQQRIASNKQRLKITDEMIENLYQIAYQLYQSNKFEESRNYFKKLVGLDITSYRFTFGLASCLYQLKDYANALHMFTTSLGNDLNNPLSAYFAAECCFELQNKRSIKWYLDKAIELAKDKPEHADIYQRCLLLKERTN